MTRERGVHALEALAHARAADALPGGRVEQGSVGGALEIVAVRREKRARGPVELGAAVRTAVEEHGESPFPAQCDETAFLKVDPQTRTLRDRVKRGSVGSGQACAHGVCSKAVGFGGFVRI